jgi:hypothetical protein
MPPYLFFIASKNVPQTGGTHHCLSDREPLSETRFPEDSISLVPFVRPTLVNGLN